MAAGLMDRRDFLSAAGAGFFAALTHPAAAALAETPAIYAAAFVDTHSRRDKMSFGVAVMTEAGECLARVPLPARGHDVVFAPGGSQAVVFARRPGTFAIVFDPMQGQKLRTINSPAGRHFYGHGAFSADGRLLYASENDFENAAGKIGIYRIEDVPVRIGEFDSHGVGPHEIALLPDRSTLVVANGGIETHPDFGRAKLNLSTMAPCLTFIDSRNGDLIEQHGVPGAFQQVSLRHLATASDGSVYFGGQNQGPKWETPPLVGRSHLGEGLRFWELGEPKARQLSNYVGSVALSADEGRLAISAPKGNQIMILSTETESVVSQAELKSGCGLAGLGQSGFVVSSEDGVFGSVETIIGAEERAVRFDNHIGQAVS